MSRLHSVAAAVLTLVVTALLACSESRVLPAPDGNEVSSGIAVRL